MYFEKSVSFIFQSSFLYRFFYMLLDIFFNIILFFYSFKYFVISFLKIFFDIVIILCLKVLNLALLGVRNLIIFSINIMLYAYKIISCFWKSFFPYICYSHTLILYIYIFLFYCSSVFGLLFRFFSSVWWYFYCIFLCNMGFLY